MKRGAGNRAELFARLVGGRFATQLWKVLGILLMVLALYAIYRTTGGDAAASVRSHQNLALRIGAWGVFVLGVAPLIISGGIDLSIGSVVGMSAVAYGLLLNAEHGPGLAPWPAAFAVLFAAPLVGLAHGLLVTKVGLQPFLATLCGLFIYRGVAQWATVLVTGSARNIGLSSAAADMSSINFLIYGKLLGVPWVLILFLLLAALVGFFLHATVHGRYLFAIGANEQAARYAGIPTHRYKIAAYIWCSTMAALAGILFLLEYESVNPAQDGSWYELYAITGAVLGGCSLRGGEGNIFSIILGATILPLLYRVIVFAGVPDQLAFIFFGVALLIGTIVDETLKRRSLARD